MAELRKVLADAIRAAGREVDMNAVVAVLPVVDRFLATSRERAERAGQLHPAQDDSGLLWCKECSYPAPCRTRRALDNGAS